MEGYVFWGGREGYETLLNTDMALEQDSSAAFGTEFTAFMASVAEYPKATNA